MQRIMVIGSCGAGKSTLARRIHKVLDLPLIHLDQHYWKAGWQESEPAAWESKVKELSNGSHWIIDGNYSGTMDIRLAKADTVILLDYPTWKCMYRVIRRILKYRGKTRPDMVKGCPERFDWDFLHYVLVFRLTRRKGILNKLKKVKKNVKVFIFRNDHSTERFLQSLKT